MDNRKAAPGLYVWVLPFFLFNPVFFQELMDGLMRVFVRSNQTEEEQICDYLRNLREIN